MIKNSARGVFGSLTPYLTFAYWMRSVKVQSLEE
jgi:hypothetical protein